MGAPNIQSLAILWLLSENTERTAAFYREVLGLKLVEERDPGSIEKHYAVQMGALRLIIRYSHDVPDEQRPLGRDSMELCFTVADMGRFLEHVREMNLAPLHPPTTVLADGIYHTARPGWPSRPDHDALEIVGDIKPVIGRQPPLLPRQVPRDSADNRAGPTQARTARPPCSGLSKNQASSGNFGRQVGPDMG